MSPYVFTHSGCGGLRTRIANVEAVLRPSGALWLEGPRILVVADLHMEKGSAYAAQGQMLPPYDTREALGRLEAETRDLEPGAVVLLGDSFHDLAGEDRLDQTDAQRLRVLARRLSLVWVTGNHDAGGPRTLPGDVVTEYATCGLTLRHEPRTGAQPGEISGHLHPCAKVKASQGVVRRRCFVTDGTRAVLPAFGAYAGGLNVRDAAFAGLFARPPLAAALGRGRVHAVGWASLTGD